MTKVNTLYSETVCQGDIYKDIDYIEYAEVHLGIVEISKITFPFIIVLTQECDLHEDQDFRKNIEKKKNQDKLLLSVIVAPIYNVAQFYDGIHLEEIGRKMTPQEKRHGKTGNKVLLQNKNPRYHYLDIKDDSKFVKSIIDFKQYFTVNVDYIISLKDSNFVCRVSELYRERISQRFANHLSRIGLPTN